MNWIGQELGEPERRLLEELKRGNPRDREFGSFAAEVLVDIVRSVAARNSLVGRGLLINSLPRWAIHPGQRATFLLAGAPLADELTFLHLPHDEEDPVLSGPRYVCEGRQIAAFEASVPTALDVFGTGSVEL